MDLKDLKDLEALKDFKDSKDLKALSSKICVMLQMKLKILKKKGNNCEENLIEEK